MTTLLLAGAIANKPGNGGNAWAMLSWARGLLRLGCRVFFLEQIAPEHCRADDGSPAPFERSANYRYFWRTMAQAGLTHEAALVYGDGERVSGLDAADLPELAASADLLINISGHLTYAPVRERVRRSVYLDLDPGYTQLWQAAGTDGARLDGHDAYYTVGANIGQSDCGIPTGDIPWRPTRPPQVLADWPVMPPRQPPLRFTTVASWRGAYGRVAHQGRTFGQKAHEMRRVASLPGRAKQTFEIALDIHPGDAADQVLLREQGWQLADPRVEAADLVAFRRYVQASDAEFSAAQGVYVDTHSGWFSDRTVRYLGSGRPALVQDTGFTDRIPAGEGLLAFRTLDEAERGVAAIVADYERQCRAARAVAEAYFDSDAVLGRLLQEVDLAP